MSNLQGEEDKIKEFQMQKSQISHSSLAVTQQQA
jgi:hypothetical protein